MAGFSPAAAILENEKTLGTRLQPTDAQGTHLKQLQLTGLPWLNMLLLLLLLLLLFIIIISIIIIMMMMMMICSLKR